MAEGDIPVDPFNPGQAFACLGFLEAADILLSEAEGAFDWHDEGDVRFRLRARNNENPFDAVLTFLRANTTTVEWLSPSRMISERDGGFTVVQDYISPSGEPKAPDLPARLSGRFRDKPCTIPFGFWADGSTRFHTTFKKSTNGASSHIRFDNALTAVRNLNSNNAAKDPFEQSSRTESLFRLDPRGNVDPIHAGTSPDKLRKGGMDMRVATFPLCEVLAIIGLEHARPEIVRKRGENAFRYHVWGGCDEKCPAFLSPVLARAAISGAFPFFDTRRFLVKHEEVKKGGDRKMTNIIEER